jgi:hypothetical protein
VDSGAVTLATTAGDLVVNAQVSAGTVTLETAGRAKETAIGALDTSLLNVTAQTGVTLTSTLNAIGAVGVDTPGSGPNLITP